MTTTSIIGTIKEIEEFDGSFYIKLKEDINWFITIDSETFPDAATGLKKGSKYYLTGTHSIFKQRFTVSEVIDSKLDNKSKQVIEAVNQDSIMMRGIISDIKVSKTMRGSEMAFIKLKDISNLNIAIFPDTYKNIHAPYEKGQEIIILGSLSDPQEPQFIIGEATPIPLSLD